MKDIGKLEDRLDTVEYYTALSLLERDAESFEVTDENGLNRFKSGFMVDNFKGHRVGDTIHKDYKCSMDFEEGELRPQHRSKAIPLIELATTDAERTTAHYQKTGDLLTLPYTEELATSQLYSSRRISCQTGLTVNWIGDITLTPSSDTWFDTEVLPDIVINQDGDYNAVLSQNRNSLGTVWNSWQTTWSGVVDTKKETRNVYVGKGTRQNQTRTVNTVRSDRTRTGVTTKINLRIDKESQGHRTVSKVCLPYARSNSVSFVAENMKPKTRLYVFFNKTSVSAHVTPASSDYSSDSSPTAGSPLISDSVGKVEGTFLIPDPKVEGNPKFQTGDIMFTLTSSSTNGIITVDQGLGTAAKEIYSASGMLETKQETIIATRNATVVRVGVLQSTTSTSAQTFSWQNTNYRGNNNNWSGGQTPDSPPGTPSCEGQVGGMGVGQGCDAQ